VIVLIGWGVGGKSEAQKPRKGGCRGMGIG
jgi:hypothetical protein